MSRMRYVDGSLGELLSDPVGLEGILWGQLVSKMTTLEQVVDRLPYKCMCTCTYIEILYIC